MLRLIGGVTEGVIHLLLHLYLETCGLVCGEKVYIDIPVFDVREFGIRILIINVKRLMLFKVVMEILQPIASTL